jgi:hypothetical protein
MSRNSFRKLVFDLNSIIEDRVEYYLYKHVYNRTNDIIERYCFSFDYIWTEINQKCLEINDEENNQKVNG